MGSTQIGTYSMGGIQGLPKTALVRLSTMSSDISPSQKEGVAVPPTANTRTMWSIQVFCLIADTAPRGMAMAMAITVARMAISREIGNRAMISVVTGLPDHIDVPKSNRAMPQAKSANWTIMDLSMPSSAWQSAIALGSNVPPLDPRRTTQTSPGINRISTNTSAAAPTSVGMTSNTRLAM